jgi:UDP-glucose 4-epimerase
LVIGAGFIGTAASRALARRGRRVTVLTRSTAPTIPGGIVDRVLVGDVCDPSVLGEALKQVSDIVYCAGGALPVEAERDPRGELERDTAPLLAVLEALTRHPHARLLLVSSGGTIYGEPARVPVDESQPLNPRSAYASIKVTAERYLEHHRTVHGVASTALRCANVYGPGQVPYRSQGVIATLLASAATGREVVVYGDGSAVRDYVHVDDVAQVIARLAELEALPPALNVGSGVGTSLIDVLELVERTVGRRLRARFEPARPTDLHRVVLDVTRLQRLVPMAPMPLAEGVRRTWQLEKAIDADAS